MLSSSSGPKPLIHDAFRTIHPMLSRPADNNNHAVKVVALDIVIEGTGIRPSPLVDSVRYSPLLAGVRILAVVKIGLGAFVYTLASYADIR